ncbi:MAG: DUF1461 domain-containing protein [Verrucomicrobiia bacterium]
MQGPPSQSLANVAHSTAWARSSKAPSFSPAFAWAFGGVQVLFSMALAAWLLTLPAVFGVYYSLLRPSAHTADAKAVVQWLRTEHRTRSLSHTLRDGKLTDKELRHFSDVRQQFPWFSRTALAAAGLAALLVARTKPSHEAFASAQSKAFWIWAALLLVLGGLALWDWKLFFAWMHQPFFGDRSWRMPRSSYSLVLFPASFWQFTAACVLLAPGLTLLAGCLATRWRTSRQQLSVRR